MTVPHVLHPFAAPAREAGDYLEIVRDELVGAIGEALTEIAGAG